jgi:hypothetical protein
MDLNFPKTVRAAKANDLSQWALGDALLKEATDADTGPRGLNAVVTELADNGVEYTNRYLRLLRQTAETFSADRRHSGIVLRAHTAAGNPDSLDVIAKAARKQGCNVTLEFVEHVLREMRADAQAKAREEQQEARREQAQAEAEELAARKRKENAETKAAKDAAEREQHKARQRKKDARAKVKASRTPKRDRLPAPKEEEVSSLAARAMFMKNANEARRLANQALKAIKPNLADYSPAAIAGLTDAAVTVQNSWHDVVTALQQPRRGKGHLSVVNE